MHELIENRAMRNDPIIQNLFVKRDEAATRQVVYSSDVVGAAPRREIRETPLISDVREPRAPRVLAADSDVAIEEPTGERFDSYVLSLKNGYGFIKYPPNNLFFHATDLLNADFPELQEGDPVEFSIGFNRDGDEVAKSVKLMLDDDVVEDDEQGI